MVVNGQADLSLQTLKVLVKKIHFGTKSIVFSRKKAINPAIWKNHNCIHTCITSVYVRNWKKQL